LDNRPNKRVSQAQHSLAEILQKELAESRNETTVQKAINDELNAEIRHLKNVLLLLQGNLGMDDI
jgi:ribosomal protein S3AE